MLRELCNIIENGIAHQYEKIERKSGMSIRNTSNLTTHLILRVFYKIDSDCDINVFTPHHCNNYYLTDTTQHDGWFL